MEYTYILQDLAIVMGVAAGMTLLCYKLRQPSVIGYLLAGLLIGPYTYPFSIVKDMHSIHTMAELGVVFLMFGLGLEFSIPRLRKIGLSAAVIATIKVLGMVFVGYKLGQAFGWNRMDSVFLGAILSISSTTIIAKILMDLKMMREFFVQVVIGILIMEDVFAVIILSILSGLGSGGAGQAPEVVRALLMVGFFVILFLVVGLSAVPKFMQWVGKFQSREMLGIVSLGLCLAGAYLASKFGFSVALGAFLMGVVMAASKDIAQIERWIHPIRDMFIAIFFVSAGMLINPQIIMTYKWPILIITLVSIFGRIFYGAIGSFLVGYRMDTSFRIGLSLAPIGEFSFIFASLGIVSGVASEFLYPVSTIVAFLTAFFMPYLVRGSGTLYKGFTFVMPKPVDTALKRYHGWIIGFQDRSSRAHKTMIFSKYLIRFAVYFVLFLAAIFSAKIISGMFDLAVPLEGRGMTLAHLFIWGIFLLISMPLFFAISRYLNHIVLLLTTLAATSLTPAKYFKYININLFYNVFYGVILVSLGALFLVFAKDYIRSPYLLSGFTASAIIIGFVLKDRVIDAKGWFESLLDEIIGLATSEPTRQAILCAEGRDYSLEDVFGQVILTGSSSVVDKSIEEINLKERSGANIVAIYRQGAHIANPPRNTELKVGDILVLIGEEEHREKAKKILLGKRS
ncbi:cation:proton antiporter [Elusimicrobiota bacterium]